MKKAASIIMGEIYNPQKDRAVIETKNFTNIVQMVRNFEEAKEYILKLVDDGVEHFELCGAFGEDKARELIKLTNNEVGISYVVTDEDMKSIVDDFYCIGKE